MKAAIIVFPGTNREQDMAMALAQATGQKPSLVWHKETDLGAPDLIVLPGGFSYGDYLRCGAMAAHSPVMKEVATHAKRGTRILGVCNGFQMLVETRLLPGALLRNRSLKFICKQVYLRCENAAAGLTGTLKPGAVIRAPVAHGEGNYFAAPDTIRELEDQGRVAFRYCDENGALSDEANPNGSTAHMAGIYNARKTILGMMPHPENAVLDWQSGHDGAALFEGLLDHIAA